MTEFKLYGSGGFVTVELTAEQARKADLGVGKLFLAPVGKLEPEKISSHHCKSCEADFDGPPEIQLDQKEDEQVADGLILEERGQYVCKKCNSILGEYRAFRKDK